MGIILSFRKLGPQGVFARLRGRAANSISSSCASAMACKRLKTASIFGSRIGVVKVFLSFMSVLVFEMCSSISEVHFLAPHLKSSQRSRGESTEANKSVRETASLEFVGIR